MTTSMGKTLRLGRLFDADSNTSIILPMDHGVEEHGYGELERPAELVASLAAAGVDAFLMRRGLAAFAASSFAGRAQWVLRLTARTGLSPGLETEQLVLASVAEALHNGADAVVPTFFIGPETEAVQLPQLGAIADECNRLGMPLLAEIFPAGSPDAAPYDGPYTVEDMRVAVRVASEEGADFIKTWYTGDPESFRRVIDYSLVPVLIAAARRPRTTGMCWRWSAVPWTPARPASPWAARSGNRAIRPGWSAHWPPSSAAGPASTRPTDC